MKTSKLYSFFAIVFSIVMLSATSCGSPFNSKPCATTDVTLEIPADLFRSITEGQTSQETASLTINLYVNDDSPITREASNFDINKGTEISFPDIPVGAKVQATAFIKIGASEYFGKSKETIVSEDGTILELELSVTKIYLELGIEDAIEQIKTLRQSCSLKITGEVTNEQLQELNNNTKNLASNVFIELDISDTTGITEIIDVFYSNFVRFDLPDSLISFTSFAFSNAENLSEISFPNGNDNFVVEDGILYDKDKTIIYRYIPTKEATSFTIPASVKRLSEGSFKLCSNLEEITIPSTLEEIDRIVFLYTYKLKKFNVTNEHYKAIDGILFSANEKELIQYPLSKTDTSYTVPDTVEVIAENAFSGSKFLKTLSIPASVSEVGGYAFYYSSIETLNYADPEDWHTQYGSYVSPQYLQNITYFKSPDSVTQLWWQTLYKTVVVEIAADELAQAIKNVENDHYVNFKVTGSMTYSDLLSLQNDVIYKKYQDDWGYNYLVGLDLREVTGLSTIPYLSVAMIGFPASVSEIIPGALSSINKVLIADDNPYFIYEDDILYNKDKTRLLWYSRNKSVTSFEIPSSVITMDNCSIYNNTYLKEITIPSTLERLGEGSTDGTGTFYGCHNLKTIRVASDNQYYEVVDGVLFTKGKEKLICYPAKMEGESYNIPKGTKEIVYGAFEYAENLRSITIPDTVIEIKNTFVNTSLTSITFENPEDWYIEDNILVTPEQLQDPASYKWSWEGGTGYLINYTIYQKTSFGLYYDGIKLSSDSENSYNFEQTLEMLETMGCTYPDDYTNSSYSITLTDSGLMKMISSMDEGKREEEKTAAVVVYNNQLLGFITAGDLSNFEASCVQDIDFTLANKINLTWIYLTTAGWNKYHTFDNYYFQLGTSDTGISLNINNLQNVQKFTVSIIDAENEYENKFKIFECNNVNNESYVLKDIYVNPNETRLYVLDIFDADNVVIKSEYLYGTAAKVEYLIEVEPADEGIQIIMNSAAQNYMSDTLVERRKNGDGSGAYAYFYMGETEFIDPFVKSGTEYTYEYRPEITDGDTGIIYYPKQVIPITATSGLGELYISNEPAADYIVESNNELSLEYSTVPQLEANIDSFGDEVKIQVDFTYIIVGSDDCPEIVYFIQGFDGEEWDIDYYWREDYAGKTLIPDDNRYRVIVEGLEGLNGNYYVESYNATNLSGMPQEITIPE